MVFAFHCLIFFEMKTNLQKMLKLFRKHFETSIIFATNDCEANEMVTL